MNMKLKVANEDGCPARPHGPRPSAFDTNQRIEIAHRLVLAGKSRAEIVATMRSTFHISERAADRALSHARERAAKESAEGREAMRAAMVKQLDRSVRRAERYKQGAAEVGALRLKAQVLGLLAPQALEVQTTVHVPPSLPEPTLEEAYRELTGLVPMLVDCVRRGDIEPTPKFCMSVRHLAEVVGYRLGFSTPAANDREDTSDTTSNGITTEKAGIRPHPRHTRTTERGAAFESWMPVACALRSARTSDGDYLSVQFPSCGCPMTMPLPSQRTFTVSPC